MEIFKNYPASENSFIKKTSNKYRVILNDTNRSELKYHINSFHLLEKSPHFTIDRDGKIFEHLNINYYSNFYKEYNDLNKESIIVSLVNAGGLVYKKDIGFVNWALDLVVEKDTHEFLWKKHMYWHNYTTKQLFSLRFLLNHISDLMNEIKPNNIFNSSIFDERAFFYSGVISESNIIESSSSLNPSFDWTFI